MCNCNGPQSDFTLIADILAKYGDTPTNLITILQKAQDIYGYLPKDVMYHIAEKIGVTPAEIVGVATFYSQFRLTPIGKYLIILKYNNILTRRYLIRVSSYLEIILIC